MTKYDGAWITTYTGKQFHYLDPQPEEIDIKDIAHHLSLLCRFNGACREFYSVAEHSVRVAELLPPLLKRSGLLHDASEAYIGDLTRPVKYTHLLEETERKVMVAIMKKFVFKGYSLEVKVADEVLLATEARDLMPNTVGWRELAMPLPEIIHPWTPKDAEASFLTYFEVWRGWGR